MEQKNKGDNIITEHYKKRINHCRNVLFKLLGKLERINIKEFVLDNDMLGQIDNNINDLDASLIRLQYDINNFIGANNNINNSRKDFMIENEKNNKIIENLLPVYMTYYMMVNENEKKIDVNELD